jgi:hypothetical protein
LDQPSRYHIAEPVSFANARAIVAVEK